MGAERKNKFAQFASGPWFLYNFFSLFIMQQQLRSQASGRAAGSSRSSRLQCRAELSWDRHAPPPPPAWPGRVPVPEAAKARTGPKVCSHTTAYISLHVSELMWLIIREATFPNVLALHDTHELHLASSSSATQDQCATPHPRPKHNTTPALALQRFSLLGSTGSIGTQTLDIIAEHPDKFELTAMAAGSNVELLAKQVGPSI